MNNSTTTTRHSNRVADAKRIADAKSIIAKQEEAKRILRDAGLDVGNLFPAEQNNVIENSSANTPPRSNKNLIHNVDVSNFPVNNNPIRAVQHSTATSHTPHNVHSIQNNTISGNTIHHNQINPSLPVSDFIHAKDIKKEPGTAASVVSKSVTPLMEENKLSCKRARISYDESSDPYAMSENELLLLASIEEKELLKKKYIDVIEEMFHDQRLVERLLKSKGGPKVSLLYSY